MKKLLIFFLGLNFAWGQNSTSNQTEKGNIVILPNLQYAPETSLGLGAALFYTKRWQNNPNNRPSIQKFYPLYTLKKQFSIGGSTDNWLNNNKLHLYFYGKYSYYPDYFYDFYNQKSNVDDKYTSEFFEMESYAESQIFPNFFAGIRADFRNEAVSSLQENGLLISGKFNGTAPFHTLGIGPQLSYDSRNNVYYPQKGIWITARLMYFSDRLSNINSFTRFDWDFRHYITLSSRGDILAYNLLYSWVDQPDIPFQMLPYVGGSKIHRGYFKGRYRGSQMITAQMDYRFTISSRFKGVLFTSIGNATPKGGLFKQKPHLAVGTGIRYRIGNEGLHIRLDIAYGQSVYPYIDALEAF